MVFATCAAVYTEKMLQGYNAPHRSHNKAEVSYRDVVATNEKKAGMAKSLAKSITCLCACRYNGGMRGGGDSIRLVGGSYLRSMRHIHPVATWNIIPT